MGAHNFHTAARGNTADEAYRAAVQQAIHDYGHDPYNGTISTTMGCVMVPLKEDESIEEWAFRVIDDPQVRKWENCAAVLDPEAPGEDSGALWHFAGWAAC